MYTDARPPRCFKGDVRAADMYHHVSATEIRLLPAAVGISLPSAVGIPDTVNLSKPIAWGDGDRRTPARLRADRIMQSNVKTSRFEPEHLPCSAYKITVIQDNRLVLREGP
jgi:hypothetical protein